jgi:hypothetical protein
MERSKGLRSGSEGTILCNSVSTWVGESIILTTGKIRWKTRFEIPEKFLPVAGTESSQNWNANRNFDLVPVISGVFMCHSMTIKGH